MTERDYLGFFLWFMAFMIAVGGMIRSLWPGLVRLVDRQVSQDDERPGASRGH